MLASSDCSRGCQLILTGSRAPVRMCRILLLMTLLYINIHVSSQVPPRVASCRSVHKAKAPDFPDYIFPTATSCGVRISFPVPDEHPINVTDLRNCDNFFKCTSYSCLQCPCDVGETFNPETLECDATRAACECPVIATTPNLTPTEIISSTIKAAIAPTSSITRKPTLVIKDAGGDLGQQGSGNSNNAANSPVSQEVIIIAAIVSATVIVIVVIVMAVFCWQRRQASHNIRMSKPVQPKLSSHSHTHTHDGYSSSIPPSEKHVYAEIDERMVNGRKHWQHGGSLRAPPLPDHEPPTSPTFTAACTHQHQHQHSDSGVGSTDTSFATNYHRRTFQPIHPPHSTPLGVAYNEQPININNHCCGEDLYNGREDSSVSTDSQYSHSSNPTSLDSRDIDMRTPLHANPKQNYISKQVYI